jgi:hypothetical protein
MIAEAIKLVRFVLSTDPGSGCPQDIAMNRDRSPSMPYLHFLPCCQWYVVVVVNVQIEAVNRRPLIVGAVTLKDLGGHRQIFLPKHFIENCC